MSRSFPLTADLLVGATVQEITMNPNLLPQIFGLYPMVYAVSPDGQAFINSSLEGIISTSDRGGGMIRYTVYSLRGGLSEEQDVFLQARQRFNRTDQRPEETVDRLSRVKELAGQWCSGLLADGPDVTTDKRNLSIARRIEQSLKENYSYTLDLSSADSGRDGVEDFLFHMRKGHCEYFASAMTVMCRLLGVRTAW